MTDNGIQFRFPPRYVDGPTARFIVHMFNKRRRQRNVMERTFNRLKDFRRIATRFDRKLKTYMAALCIVPAIVW